MTAGRPQGYFQQSQDLYNSLVLILPLLLLYQAGLLLYGSSTLNGADVISVLILTRFGWDGLMVFGGALLLGGLIGAAVLQRKSRLEPSIMGPMVIESTAYAVLLGVIITQVLQRLPLPNAAGDMPPSTFARVCVALGAGVNEELVFRLALFGGLLRLLRRSTPEGPGPVLAAVGISSVLFSLAHYLGAEPFALYSFAYRFLAGVLFCVLFWARGLGIAVYTHAIYDVLVLVVLAK